MKYYIIIDTGTTNTRIRLLNEQEMIIDDWESNTGVRVTAIEGNNQKLKSVIKNGIEEIIKRNSISKDQIERIIASGMITSNVGLIEVPHIKVPAGKEEIKSCVKELCISDVSEIPISFVPGVKNDVQNVNLDNFEEMDIMRGEESEIMAILQRVPRGVEYLIVLPGSHNKFVRVNKNGKIIGCMTTLSGELLECVSKTTIIADSVDHKFSESYDKNMILIGYHTAMKVGLTRAIFSARILSQFVFSNANKIANYLLGAILQSDMEALKGTEAIHMDSDTVIVVAGKDGLRKALVDIFNEEMTSNTIDEYAYNSNMSAEGVISIFSN